MVNRLCDATELSLDEGQCRLYPDEHSRSLAPVKRNVANIALPLTFRKRARIRCDYPQETITLLVRQHADFTHFKFFGSGIFAPDYPLADQHDGCI